MLKLIHDWPEGVAPRQGINWRRDRASSLVLFIYIWRLGIYFRRRSDWIMEGNPDFKPRDRYIFDIDWR